MPALPSGGKIGMDSLGVWRVKRIDIISFLGTSHSLGDFWAQHTTGKYVLSSTPDISMHSLDMSQQANYKQLQMCWQKTKAESPTVPFHKHAITAWFFIMWIVCQLWLLLFGNSKELACLNCFTVQMVTISWQNPEQNQKVDIISRKLVFHKEEESKEGQKVHFQPT